MKKRLPPIPTFFLLILLWAVVPTATAKAQTDPIPQFSQLSVPDGLSDITTIDMIQDNQGFMWFGTQNGLNRYDGYEFVVYTHDPTDTNSLSHSNITAVYQDDAGMIWVGTRGGGLNRLDPTTDQITRYRHQPDDPQTISNNFINAIDGDEHGNLWISTENGLNYFDTATLTAVHYPTHPDQAPNPSYLQVNDIIVAPDKTVWMATGGGLAWLAPHADDVTYSDDQTGIPDQNINDIHIDTAGVAWAGADDGLYKLTNDREVIAHYQYDSHQDNGLSADVVWTIYEDSLGRLWLGMRGGGLTMVDAAAETFTHYQHDPDNPHSISGDFILAIYEDNAGTLWASAWTGGLNLLSPYQFKFPPVIPVQTAPLAIYGEENGRFWAGTFGQGLAQVDSVSGNNVYYQHDPDDPQSLSNDIVFVLEPSERGLWAGTLYGLNFFDFTTKTFTRYLPDPDNANGLSDSTIRSLHEDETGIVWVGTSAGLNRLDPENGRFTPYNQAANAPTGNIWAIYQVNSDSFWLGADNGLYHFNPQTEAFQNYAQASSSQDIGITVIYQDPDGILWLGTWGQGLIRFDPANQTSTHYQTDSGLLGTVVLGILTDKNGHLWLSTNRGIAHFDPVTEQFRMYDQTDGLAQDDFVQGAYWQNAQGEMFFGAPDSIVHFYPDQLPNNPYAPPVYLTDFQLYNQPVVIGPDSPLTQSINHTSEIILTHDQAIFSFEFAALNFISPDKNQFAYMMEGVDPDWNIVDDRRFVTYTNLDPGEYHFRVRAANNDGMWNNDGVDVRILVRPPWWRSGGAYLFYVLALALSIFGYNSYRVRRQKRALAEQNKELLWERRLRESIERMDRLKDEERARIARELHDGLAQTLAGIRFRTRTWKTLLDRDPQRILPELDELSETLDMSIQDVRRSIYALRPLSLDELGLETAVSRFSTDLSQFYQVDIQTYIQKEIDIPEHLEHDSFRIVQELLYNAVQHGRPQTTWVQIKVYETELFIQIEDDGIGFDLQQMPTYYEEGHFGIKQVRERVALRKGKMSLSSQPNQGTSVSISLPIAK